MKIAVYCSSREDLGPDVTGAAEMVGSAIGRCGATLVYGGVNAGLMHTVAGAASRAGARVLGVVPEVSAIVPILCATRWCSRLI